MRARANLVIRAGAAYPDGVLPPTTTVAEAEAQLEAGADNDVVDVVNASTGRLFCQLRRLSSGVYLCNYLNWRNASASMFTISSSGTPDIFLSGASVDIDFDDTLGVVSPSTSADGYIRFDFAGDFNPRVHGLRCSVGVSVSSAGDGTIGGFGLLRPDTAFGLAGGVARAAGVWSNRGIYGTMTAPVVSGGGAIGGAPTGGQVYVSHAGRDALTQGYVSAGYADNALPPSIPGYISGAHVSNWNTATSFRLHMLTIRVGGGNDFVMSAAETSIAAGGA